MADELADRLARAEQIVLRAVVVPDGADPGPILAQHGMIDAVAIPYLPDDGTGDAAKAMGDGLQGGVQATLVMDQDNGAGANDGSQVADGLSRRGPPDQAAPSPATKMLASAYGMTPMAPVRQASE